MTQMEKAKVVAVAALLIVGCGGGGDGADDLGTSDLGISDIRPQDEDQQEASEPDAAATDPWIEAIVDDFVMPDLTGQDLTKDVAMPDVAAPDAPSHDFVNDSEEPSKFVVRVMEEADAGQDLPVVGAEVAILDNNTGQPTGLSGETDQDGTVEFHIKAGQVFAVSVKKDPYIHRYFFDVRGEWGFLDVGMLRVELIDMVANQIGLSWDRTKGIVAGQVVFPSEQGDESVGCAVVESDKGGPIRYWDPVEDMPTTLDKAPMTSKKNSNFLVANVPPGPVNLTVKVAGQTVATRTAFSFEGALISVDIAVVTATNPTPPDCQY